MNQVHTIVGLLLVIAFACYLSAEWIGASVALTLIGLAMETVAWILFLLRRRGEHRSCRRRHHVEN
ncbi:MAG: hypothetical protein AAF488_05255 [Planctomycetota bacterium]